MIDSSYKNTSLAYGKIYRIGKMLEGVAEELLRCAEEAGYDPKDTLGEPKNHVMQEDADVDENFQPEGDAIADMMSQMFKLPKASKGRGGQKMMIVEVMKKKMEDDE